MNEPRFISVLEAAAKLGVPAAWLKREADSGRVPAIRAGRRLRIDPDAVARVLLERARISGVRHD
ncbi:MAG: helix-turn-helix domain-containing protein [Phycisphaeraceae bacterium]|nr:helix-turn-helix domain-containing protein [Phycisphaeraceae bacterium]